MKKKVKKTKSPRAKSKGFTMIELILVITVLGILAVMALPSFFDISGQAAASSRDGVIGGVRGGINMFRANALTTNTTPLVPADLDAIASYPTTCSSTAPCFGSVLQDPVLEGRWVKSAALTYTWAPTVGGTATTTCTYNATTGAFAC